MHTLCQAADADQPRRIAEFRVAALTAKLKMTVLLVEQNIVLALEVARRAYVIENGHIVLEGPARDLARHRGCAKPIWERKACFDWTENVIAGSAPLRAE